LISNECEALCHALVADVSAGNRKSLARSDKKFSNSCAADTLDVHGLGRRLLLSAYEEGMKWESIRRHVTSDNWWFRISIVWCCVVLGALIFLALG
jgi:hypothetical protein